MGKAQKKTVKKTTQMRENNKIYSILEYIIFAIFGITILISPYYRGLYFDYELLVFQAVIGSLFIVFVFYKFITGDKFELKDKMEYILLIFMVAYLIPYLFAANKRLAIGEFFKYAFYFAIFILASRLSKGYFERKTILNILFISTVGVAFFGFQASVGLISENARPFGMPMNGLWAGNMINSTLQYHNTAGTVLAFGIIISMLLGVLNENKLLSSLYWGVSSVLWTAFIYTYSRGALVTIPIAILVFFVLLPREKRISLVFNTALTLAPFIILLSKVGAAMTPNNKVKLFLLLLIQFAAAYLLSLGYSFVHEKFAKLSNKTYVISAILLVVIGIIGFIIAANMNLIPKSLLERITSISFKERNFIERLVFYKDGLKIFLRSPLFGFGGGTWVSLYFAYQSYLYFTTQSHNYFLQVLLDTGLFGFSILLIFLWILYRHSLKSIFKLDKINRIILAGAIGATVQLYLHAILDFDFSLAAVQVLLYTTIGIMYSIVRGYYKENKQEKEIEIKRPSKALPYVLVAFYFVFIFISISFRQGHYYANIGSQALQQNSLTAAYQFLSKAVGYDWLNSSARSDYATTLARIADESRGSSNAALNQSANTLIRNAYNHFKIAINNDRYNSRIRQAFGAFLLSHGSIDEGLKQLEEAAKLQPLRPANYELIAEAYYKVGEYYLGKGETEKAKKYYQEVVKIPERMMAIKRQKERMPEVVAKDPATHIFTVTDKVKEYVKNAKAKL